MRRYNHYVPEWYQRGFISGSKGVLHYLDLTPDHKALPDGRVITMNPVKERSVDKCFAQYDLYSTFLGGEVSDEIESMLFGGIDDKGARAVRAFAQNDPAGWHKHFQEFFGYIDAQKARTPKGLSWIRQHYAGLDQNALMQEMQSVRNMHCTICVSNRLVICLFNRP